MVQAYAQVADLVEERTEGLPNQIGSRNRRPIADWWDLSNLSVHALALNLETFHVDPTGWFMSDLPMVAFKKPTP